MAKALFANGVQSPTAVNGLADYRVDNVYSSLVVASGGASNTDVFTVPKGQSIPEIKGSSITATNNPHQQTYTYLTTNLEKAGEIGQSIGDITITALGVTFETAPVTVGGTVSGFGLTPFDVADVLAKTSMDFQINKKRMLVGPVFTFPNLGSFIASSSPTGTSMPGAAQNGSLPGGRKLGRYPLVAARNDTILANWAVAPGSAYVFSTATGYGQPGLAWIVLNCLVRGDVR